MTKLGAPEDTPRNAPICGLLGVAMLAGMTFQDVVPHFDAVRSEADPRARKLGKGWKGYTYESERTKVLERLGVNVGCFELGDRTLRHFALTQRDGWPLMVQARGHIMTVCNGLVYDQSYPEGIHVDKHFCKKRTVIRAWYNKDRGNRMERN